MPICQAASEVGGICSGKCLVSTVPSPTQIAPASAMARPGSLPMPASMLLPPIRMKMPPSATISATARAGDSRSPRTGQASSATHTGTEIASTAASRASSHTSASPMKATHALIVSRDASTSRSHTLRGNASR